MSDEDKSVASCHINQRHATSTNNTLNNVQDIDSQSANNSSTYQTPSISPNDSRKRPGRPLGSTNESKRIKLSNEKQAKYKITCRYLHKMETIKKGSKARKQRTYPGDAKLIDKIEIDPNSGEIFSIKMKGANKENDLKLEIIGSLHEHDVTGGLKAKLCSAAIVAQAGIDVQIVRCCSQTAEQALYGIYDTELGTIITQRQIN